MHSPGRCVSKLSSFCLHTQWTSVCVQQSVDDYQSHTPLLEFFFFLAFRDNFSLDRERERVRQRERDVKSVRSCQQGPWSSCAHSVWTRRSSRPRCSLRTLPKTKIRGRVDLMGHRCGRWWILRLRWTYFGAQMSKISVKHQYERIHVNRMFASGPAEEAFDYYQEMKRKASLRSQSQKIKWEAEHDQQSKTRTHLVKMMRNTSKNQHNSHLIIIESVR